MKVILRDDDTSYFTRIDMLETVYGKLWQRGIPVCLSVIPDHRTGIIPHEFIRILQKSPYNLNVPPEVCETNESHTIDRNPNLCAFLNDLVEKGLVEIVIHGLWHGDEFSNTNPKLIEESIEESLKILKTNFPNSALKTIVPPYEILSSTARDVMLAAGYDISTTYESFYIKTRLDKLRHLPNRLRKKFISSIPAQTIKRKDASTLFFGTDVFGLWTSPEDSLSEAIVKFDECLAEDKTFICTNHYWFFYEAWKKPREGIIEAWEKFLDHMLSKSNVQWTTFEKHSPGGKNRE